jgi:hypothetical protein
MVGDTIFITSCRKIFHSYYAKTEVGDAAPPEDMHNSLSTGEKRQKKDV